MSGIGEPADASVGSEVNRLGRRRAPTACDRFTTADTSIPNRAATTPTSAPQKLTKATSSASAKWDSGKCVALSGQIFMLERKPFSVELGRAIRYRPVRSTVERLLHSCIIAV